MSSEKLFIKCDVGSQNELNRIDCGVGGRVEKHWLPPSSSFSPAAPQSCLHKSSHPQNRRHDWQPWKRSPLWLQRLHKCDSCVSKNVNLPDLDQYLIWAKLHLFIVHHRIHKLEVLKIGDIKIGVLVLERHAKMLHRAMFKKTKAGGGNPVSASQSKSPLWNPSVTFWDILLLNTQTYAGENVNYINEIKCLKNFS